VSGFALAHESHEIHELNLFASLECSVGSDPDQLRHYAHYENEGCTWNEVI
jgi:hypothetical protein